MHRFRSVEAGLFFLSLTTLLLGLLSLAELVPFDAALIWLAGTVAVLLWLLGVILTAFSQGAVGLDVIAAFSMAGSLYLGEYLTGNVIAVMFAGGQMLEMFAQSRARREMSELLSRAPLHATRYDGDRLVQVSTEAIRIDDLLLIRPGDVVPVDGIVSAGTALLDESVMTGESVPVSRAIGERIVSGVSNIGGSFDMVATSNAEGSTFAAIVRLVENAEREKAPLARLADRYAMVLLAFTISLGIVAWFLSHDPVRVLAVFVVATPCPLIVAVPVAIVSGLSRCAKIGVLVKNGGALEAMAKTNSVLFDKTGTITRGEPVVRQLVIHPAHKEDEVISKAATLAQSSHHSVSKALVAFAAERSVPVHRPTEVVEEPGQGVSGRIEGRLLSFGTFDFVASRVEASEWMSRLRHQAVEQKGLVAAIGIDREMVGLVHFQDRVRTEAAQVMAELRGIGLKRIGLLTGDRRQVAEALAVELAFDHVEAEATPSGKVDRVKREKEQGVVAMVGDGVNDAPALAAADIGIALGVKGVGASAEAADAIVLVDGLEPLPDAFRIARRSFRIAGESVILGLGLSVVGMIAAALGALRPIEGAILQELIDVAAILNALRALGVK